MTCYLHTHIEFVRVAAFSYLIQQNHQLQMQDFQLALHVATGNSMDTDEIECVLTNLIFKGYIKGYMSHTKKILVVSKTQPFPPIVSVSS